MLLTRTLSLYFLAALLWSFSASAGKGPRSVYQRAYRSGQPGALVDDLRTKIESDPANVDYHALLANSLTRMGMFSEAIAEFDEGRGSLYYEEDGIACEADSLRAFGRGREAMELRLQRRIMIKDDYAESLLLLEASEDARLAGDPWTAEDLVIESMSIYPNSAEAWAALAEAWIDQGRIDDAEFAIWRGRQTQIGSLRLFIAEARIDLLNQEPLAAHLLLNTAYLKYRNRYILGIYRMYTNWKLGKTKEALEIATQKRYANREFPDMMALRIIMNKDLGQLEDAQEVLDRALRFFPKHPRILEAQRYLAAPVDSHKP